MLILAAMPLACFVPDLTVAPRMVWSQHADPVPTGAQALTLTSAGALAVNLRSAVLPPRHRRHGGSLGRAALLPARRGAPAFQAIRREGLVTACHWRARQPAPGLGISAL